MQELIIGFFIGCLFVVANLGDFELIRPTDDGKLVVEHKGKVYLLKEMNTE